MSSWRPIWPIPKTSALKPQPQTREVATRGPRPMTTQVAEIGIAAGRTLAETGGEVETIAKSEERNDQGMVEIGFAMIEIGTAATTETAAMTAIVATKEIGGTTAIAMTAGIAATNEISAVIGTGGVAMVVRVTTIGAAWTVRILQGAKNRRGRGSERKKIGFGETKIWSSSRSRNRVGICGTRKLRMLVLTQSRRKGALTSLLTDGTMRVRRTRAAVERGGEGSVARTRSPRRKGPACTWMRRSRMPSGGRGAHSSRIVRRSPF
mmetsp:Transcript_20637/g.43370  ORF Transcript_20637/g.43370 Transcript_20637/m.43370 type:complete len:265 (+) Transcript_20637:667-1461(+)